MRITDTCFLPSQWILMEYQPTISDKIVETFYSVDIHKRQSATKRKLQLEADKKET